MKYMTIILCCFSLSCASSNQALTDEIVLEQKAMELQRLQNEAECAVGDLECALLDSMIKAIEKEIDSLKEAK